ncbi:uncharacterized protein YndB with AHSA1/START domain [Bacillus oleivorans]|uniref:Uncharacterized protein YndB with AHSA1/START domain n=1 Tax=Bacillus oleivorans TaxID=1448271 RepID=A0A285CR41_9BACI|nr:SRPBCC family protein [Bacillus oleivorans]SNX70002.1 uncharacterized protein YndB with AHSA1/START domain [Bacillus oleivorans]
MLANIEKVDNGYIARFERFLNAPVREVWSWLTENDKLSHWFSELTVDKLRPGGFILFDMQDGTFEKMEITDLDIYSVLEYTWGEDKVRFELKPESEGCHLVMIEKIEILTEHTPRDLAGWHVCLDVIQSLIEEGRPLSARKEEWQKWYPKYKQAVEGIL